MGSSPRSASCRRSAVPYAVHIFYMLRSADSNAPHLNETADTPGSKRATDMRAVTIREPGGPITVQDREVRAAGPGEVRLRVSAAAVNPVDTLMWRTFAGTESQLSLTPGMDAAGTVESVGPGVDRLSVGDAVMAVLNARLPDGGAQAELVVVPAASVVTIPDGLDAAAASALPMNGLTALEGLHLLNVPPGATLAVTVAPECWRLTPSRWPDARAWSSSLTRSLRMRRS